MLSLYLFHYRKEFQRLTQPWPAEMGLMQNTNTQGNLAKRSEYCYFSWGSSTETVFSYCFISRKSSHSTSCLKGRHHDVRLSANSSLLRYRYSCENRDEPTI